MWTWMDTTGTQNCYRRLLTLQSKVLREEMPSGRKEKLIILTEVIVPLSRRFLLSSLNY